MTFGIYLFIYSYIINIYMKTLTITDSHHKQINENCPYGVKKQDYAEKIIEGGFFLQENSQKAGIELKDFPAFVKWLKENEAGSIQEFAQRFKKENES